MPDGAWAVLSDAERERARRMRPPAWQRDFVLSHYATREILARYTATDPAALEFYRTCPGGQLIVACQEDRVVGVSFAPSFGRTGWIGNGATDTDVRGIFPGCALARPSPASTRSRSSTCSASPSASGPRRPVG